MDNFSAEERKNLKTPKFFYEITFDKPGGIPMPLIVEYTYKDGSKETITYPVQAWRKNAAEISKVLATDKEVVGIVVDPELRTADIDMSNNSWPKKETESDFDKFKNKVKGE